jgi:hypothetical protein
VFLSRAPRRSRKSSVRLACIRHAASVRPEPGSNSSWVRTGACRQTRGPTSRTPNTKRASSRFSCEGTAAVGRLKNQGHADKASTWRTASVRADPERPYLQITGSTRQASETTKTSPSRSIAHHPAFVNSSSSRVACYSSQRGLLYHAVNDLSSGIKDVLKSFLQAIQIR